MEQLKIIYWISGKISHVSRKVEKSLALKVRDVNNNSRKIYQVTESIYWLQFLFLILMISNWYFPSYKPNRF